MNWPQFWFLGEGIGVIQPFQLPQYSDRRDALFELLNGTTGQLALLLLCAVIPIDNALRG